MVQFTLYWGQILGKPSYGPWILCFWDSSESVSEVLSSCFNWTIGDVNLSSIFSVYTNVVSELVTESYEDALMNEIVSYEDMPGINILTDAKNSMFSDVVCIGANTHKVLRSELICKIDSLHAQSHELIGTRRIYDYFDSVDDGISVHVRLHCHDRNTSVNKYVNQRNKGTVSTNDTWHATKNLAKEVKKVTTGPKYQEGKTSHP